MLISKALADLRARIEQFTVLRRKNQILRHMLPDIILPAPAKNVLIVVDDITSACLGNCASIRFVSDLPPLLAPINMGTRGL